MKASNTEHTSSDWATLIGVVATPLRLIVGWQFLSTFLRRFILAPDKLDPSSAQYVGYKLAHFMPNALGISPAIEYLIQPSHGTQLFTFLIIFSVVELLVGLGLVFGVVSRLSGLGAALLSFGILLGAGWLGPTCLDEWQIGIAGIGGGLVLFLAGGGPWSLDYLWQKKWPNYKNNRLIIWLTSGDIFKDNLAFIKRVVLVFSIAAIAITLYTNQAFYGGVFGKLHNPSKHPHIEVIQPVIYTNGDLKLSLYRNEGPDTYGAFVVNISVKDASNKIVENFDASYLSNMSETNIKNHYIEKIHPGKYGLVVPLSSKAVLKLTPETSLDLKSGLYTIHVMDVSGTSWQSTYELK